MLVAQRLFRFWYPVPCALLLAGCVTQHLSVRSNPPGARVFINGNFVGETPLTTDFTWYTNYLIHVEKAGYLPVDERQAVRAPWYMWIPMDTLADAVPWHIKDERRFSYDLIAAADGIGPPLWPMTTPAATRPSDTSTATPATSTMTGADTR